jgi:hypothetical protein
MKKKLSNLCIAYLTCADENGHEFGERTELIKKLSGKLQNNRRTVQWLEMPTSILFIFHFFPIASLQDFL